jgi:O-antigen/teichoic acid export membrane protein
MGIQTVSETSPLTPAHSAAAPLDGTADLDSSLVSGIAWTAVLRWGAQFVSWAATFYAARILHPSDFGLASMAMLAIGLVRLAENFGLDAILVQDRTMDRGTEAKLAGLLMLTGFALAAGLALCAPLVAAFFREPRVTNVVRALSVLMVLDAVQVIPRAHLQRRLDFRRLAMVAFVRNISTAAVLFTAATIGFGVWALILNTLAGTLAATALLVWWNPFRIAPPRELSGLARPLLQGWRVLASRAAWYGYTTADQTIIGRVLGSSALGAYSFAVTFSTLAQEETGSVVSQVVPGVFSQVQSDLRALRRYFFLLTEFLTVISFPVVAGVALLADLAIPLVLGDKWHDVIVPLRLLCIYSAFLSSQALMSHVLMWTGQFRIQMWLSILAAATMPLVLLLAVRHGLVGVGLMWAVVFPILNIPQFYFTFRTLQSRLSEWLDALRPALVACAAMAVCVIAVRALLPSNMALLAKTILAVCTGVVSYIAVLGLAFRGRIRELLSVAMSIRNRPAVVNSSPA